MRMSELVKYAVKVRVLGDDSNEYTCILSTAEITDSKPKQIVNLNKWLFGVRIGVWT